MYIIMDKEVARLLEKFRSGRITSEELQKLKSLMEITSDQELIALAVALRENPEIRYCPHGRPVSITLKKREIEKQFGRIQ